MLKSFGIGILIVLVLLIFSLVKQDMNLLMQYSAMSGIIALVIAAVIAGVLGSGDRIRANYTHEESDERKERIRLSLYFLMISIPNLVTAIIMYLFFSKVDQTEQKGPGRQIRGKSRQASTGEWCQAHMSGLNGPGRKAK